MRYFFLCLCLLPYALIAQRTTQISGSVDSDLSRVTVTLDPLHLNDPARQTIVKVSEGDFSAEIPNDGPQIMTLTAGKRTIDLFVRPGDAVEVQFNGSEADAKVLVMGDQKDENTYFLEFQEAFEKELNSKQMEGKVKGASIDMWELELYSVRQAMQKSLQEGRNQYQFSADFDAFITTHIEHFYPRWLLAYPIVRANANTKAMEVRNLPRTIEQGLKLGELSGEQLNSKHVRDFVAYYITYFNSKDNGFQKFKDYNKNVLTKSAKAQEVLSGEVATWYQAQLCFEWCEKIAPGTMAELREEVNDGKNGKKYSSVLDTRCDNVLAAKEQEAKDARKNSKGSKDRADNNKMPKGERYPVKMVDLEGNQVNFSDFEGKVVYIDFWASWCGPCRRQFPFSKQLHADLEDKLGKKGMKEVVFLYVSIDKSEASWKKAVDQFSLQGVQVRSAPSWPDGAAAAFQINGIPRYMIMNKEGEIVQTNAKRPSMPGIIDDIVNLL